MKPYYQDELVTIYHGDAREILPSLLREHGPYGSAFDAIITDPVWPNAKPELAGSNDPEGLLRMAAEWFPVLAHRVAVQLGCDSDPRVLRAIPESLPFFRACWLEYVRPHYKGRLLYTNDVAYVFGQPPKSKEGAHVIPGRMIQTDAATVPHWHPCPRQLQHVKWLVKWFAEGAILDPFMGSGTTLLAAKQAGLPCVGIEIEEAFCEWAANRMSQMAMIL